MILCGGFGKRFGSVTKETPKSLLEIKKGYTILDRQIFDFSRADVKKVYLLTGYLSKKIEKRYGDGFLDVEIKYIKEDEPLGTLHAINLGIKNVKEDAIIRNGDVIADFNLKRMIQQSRKSNFPLTMYITKMPSPYGVIELEGDRIKSFREKPLLNYYINAGVYYVKKEVFPFFSKYKEGDVEKTIFPLLAEEGKIGFYVENSVFWRSIDTFKDLNFVREEYRNRTDKPWGYEKLLIKTEHYLMKKLYIMENYQTSFHYHREKDEAMFVQSGKGTVVFENKKKEFKTGDVIRIKPNTPHSINASENTIIFEVSTPHLGDTVRIKDFYTRLKL